MNDSSSETPGLRRASQCIRCGEEGDRRGRADQVEEGRCVVELYPLIAAGAAALKGDVEVLGDRHLSMQRVKDGNRLEAEQHSPTAMAELGLVAVNEIRTDAGPGTGVVTGAGIRVVVGSGLAVLESMISIETITRAIADPFVSTCLLTRQSNRSRLGRSVEAI